MTPRSVLLTQQKPDIWELESERKRSLLKASVLDLVLWGAGAAGDEIVGRTEVAGIDAIQARNIVVPGCGQ